MSGGLAARGMARSRAAGRRQVRSIIAARAHTGVPNLATKYLAAHGETVADWDGACGELANKIIGPEDDILYVEGAIAWRYHMVPLIRGFVHDAWCEGDALPPRVWLEKMFGNAQVEVSLNGETIYAGPADKFQNRPAAGGAHGVTRPTTLKFEE